MVAGAIVCAAVLRLLLIDGTKRVVTIAPNVRAVRLRVSNPAGSNGGAIELTPLRRRRPCESRFVS